MNDMQKSSVLSALSARKNSRGFTLIEVSIVIMIIGMVVATIVAGNMLIEAAKVRKQITQIERIESGIHNFRNKYNCMPGDCLDPTVISGYTYTGNGNGYLESTWNSDENKGFWIHLTQSQMIEDTLKAHGVLANMRVPQMKLNDLGIINAYGSMTYAQSVLEFGTNTVNGAVSQTQIRSMDKKLDDGLAASGIIRSSGYGSGATTVYAADPTFPLSTSNKSGATHCVSSGVYSGSATSLECNMIFVLGN